MADESPPLNDVDYFTYFKNQTDEFIFDKFCKLWENFDLNLFDVFTHFNTLEVIKFMLERFEKLSAAAKEKDKKIEILEMEKSEAIQNVNKESLENTKLQRKINELEYFLEERTDEEIVEFKEQIKQLEAHNENKRISIQKYRSERDSAEKKLKDIRQTKKETDAEVEALTTANEKLQSDLNVANESIRQLQNEISNLQICQNGKLKAAEYETNQFKTNFIAKDMELKNVQIKLEWAQKELFEFKQKFQSHENSNIHQSEISQLQKALTCSSDQNEKLKDDLLAAQNALKKLKDGKTTALNEIAKSLKDCGNLKKPVTKTLPPKKELIERLKSMEIENNILKEENEKYRILFEMEKKKEKKKLLKKEENLKNGNKSNKMEKAQNE
uniref:Uncharacterized protein n=1 Tax=Panagrolaimus sp. PS1159 TaxID=55785 RepID=A0AC35GWT4_9BILA